MACLHCGDARGVLFWRAVLKKSVGGAGASREEGAFTWCDVP